MFCATISLRLHFSQHLGESRSIFLTAGEGKEAPSIYLPAAALTSNLQGNKGEERKAEWQPYRRENRGWQL